MQLNEVASILRAALNDVLGDQALSDEFIPLEVVSPQLDEDEYMQECDRFAARMQPLKEKLLDLDSSIFQALYEFASQRINPNV